LKARLARTLGEEVADRHPEQGVAAAIATDLHVEVERLLVAQDDLRPSYAKATRSSRRRDV
jgi:hypothetical protein